MVGAGFNIARLGTKTCFPSVWICRQIQLRKLKTPGWILVFRVLLYVFYVPVKLVGSSGSSYGWDYWLPPSAIWLQLHHLITACLIICHIGLFVPAKLFLWVELHMPPMSFVIWLQLQHLITAYQMITVCLIVCHIWLFVPAKLFLWVELHLPPNMSFTSWASPAQQRWD